MPRARCFPGRCLNDRQRQATLIAKPSKCLDNLDYPKAFGVLEANSLEGFE